MMFPKSLFDIPNSSTAKLIYCRILDATLADGVEDESGQIFICIPIGELTNAITKSQMTVKRTIRELEKVGLLDRRQQGFGKLIRMYVMIPEVSNSAADAHVS